MNFQRVYFYYVDFDGNLYHDNSLITDKKFLDFFFKQIRYNHTGYFEEYPFISPCGKEMNFIACPDTPIVLRTLKENQLQYAGTLKVEFKPEKLVYISISSLLYYLLPNNFPARIGKYVLTELANEIEQKNGKFYYQNLSIPAYHSFQEWIQKINTIHPDPQT